ncbi:hypothetical protein [Polynucleobacter necessarius]|nr:hypothetical protein [Polynucleobacter necessarius]
MQYTGDTSIRVERFAIFRRSALDKKSHQNTDETVDRVHIVEG